MRHPRQSRILPVVTSYKGGRTSWDTAPSARENQPEEMVTLLFAPVIDLSKQCWQPVMMDGSKTTGIDALQHRGDEPHLLDKGRTFHGRSSNEIRRGH
jgi:hypothetical protein